MFPGQPSASELLANTVTATGTLLTIPAGKWFTGNLTLSATVAIAGSSSPTVTTSGTNVAPAANTVIHRINATGLATSGAADSCSTEILILAPPENSVTLQFTAGASGTSSASVIGYVF